MDSILEKSLNRPRGLLFGLLVNCIFSAEPSESCPLSELRSSFSNKEKYRYVMGLNDDEIKSILAQHEECYEKRLSTPNQW
jgi:hypothetical protein